MPKQIKTEKLPEGERKNAKLGIAAMLTAFAFGGTLMALLSVLEKGGSAGTVLGIAVAVCLVLFLGICLWHCIQGIVTFEKQDNYGVLLTSVLTAFSAFAAIVNIQTGLTLFFSSIGMEDTASKIIGGRSFSDFMAGQRTAWILMIAGVSSAVIAGIAAISKLGKHPQK